MATFAADTTLFISNSNCERGAKFLQEDLNHFVNWAQKWRIALNASKTICKVFTLRRIPILPPLRILNTPIPWADKSTSIKYLGLYFDTKLTWKDHISKVEKSTKRKIGKLYPLINKKSHPKTDTAISIYKSIVRPSMTYAFTIWGGASNSTLKKLQTIQNKFLRLAIKAPWYITNEQIHNELNMPLLTEFLSKLSNSFLSNLNQCPSINTFNLNRNGPTNPRVKSKFPKDVFFPP